MNTFSMQRLLVPVDGSATAERAVSWASALAGDTGEIMLMLVTPKTDDIHDLEGSIVSKSSDLSKRYAETATKVLEDARERLLPERENVSLLVAEGDPTDRILWAAETRKADMIVMSSHGRGSLGRLLSGSVADRVMRHASVPVMVIGPEKDDGSARTVSRILAPIDDSSLSIGALPVAAGIARATGAPVEILTVVPPSIEELPAPHHAMQPIPGSFYSDQMAARENDAEKRVVYAIEQLETMGATASGGYILGSINKGLLEAVQPGDVLVVASHARSGLPRWVLGSTAMKLIQAANAPVVVVTREFLERDAR